MFWFPLSFPRLGLVLTLVTLITLACSPISQQTAHCGNRDVPCLYSIRTLRNSPPTNNSWVYITHAQVIATSPEAFVIQDEFDSQSDAYLSVHLPGHSMQLDSVINITGSVHSLFGSPEISQTAGISIVQQNSYDASIPNLATLPISPEFHKYQWEHFCIDQGGSIAPRISNHLVAKAANALSIIIHSPARDKMNDSGFAFYPGSIGRIYTETLGTVTETVSSEVVAPHVLRFLKMLCGEYRDRPSMIAAKLAWYTRIYPIQMDDQPSSSRLDSPWQGLNSTQYYLFVRLSYLLHTLRTEALKSIAAQAHRPLLSVPPLSVCETKYLLAFWVKPLIQFTKIESFYAYYPDFANRQCSQNDLEDVYIFRGDSNLKPLTPEANAMLFESQYYGLNCDSWNKARILRGYTNLADESCHSYYNAPFQTRLQAAHDGMSLFFDIRSDINTAIQNDKAKLLFLPRAGRAIPEIVLLGTSEQEKAQRYSLGNSAPMRFSIDNLNRNNILERLRSIVDRHSFWYTTGYAAPTAIGFNYQFGIKRNGAFSPMIASSWDIFASDLFTSPGYTVPDTFGRDKSYCYKHFMFIFRTRRDRVNTAQSLTQDRIIDFTTNWLDGSSIGHNEWSQNERASNRFATPLEDEFEAILYLHNLKSNALLLDQDGELTEFCKTISKEN